MRQQFGCDGDGDPGYRIWCPWCYPTPNRRCFACHGEGEIRFAECPVRRVTAEVREAHASYARWNASGSFPVAGGQMDQSVACLAAYDVLAACYGAIERRMIDEARRPGHGGR